MTMPQATSPEGSEQFGTLLRSHREARFLSLEELAARAHLSSSYLSLVERGHRPPPPRGTLGKLLNALNVSLEEAQELSRMAEISRGVPEVELDLPQEVQELIQFIRSHGNQLPPLFVKALRAKIREVL